MIKENFKEIVIIAFINLLIWITGNINSPFYIMLPLFFVIYGLSFRSSRIMRLTILASIIYLSTNLIPLHLFKNSIPEYAINNSTILKLSLQLSVLFITSIIIKSLSLKSKKQAQKLVMTQEKLIEAQKKLITDDKQQPLSLLIGGVSHELKTPLTSIMGFSEIALQKIIKNTADPNDLKEYLKTIIQSADHCLIIIQDLLDLARSSKKNKKAHRVFDINSCIENTVKIIRHHMKVKNIDITKKYDDNMGQIKGNYNQIRQVLLNLLINARDAIHNDGEISIKTTQEGNLISIAIVDSGSGITEEDLKHIFEPFYTTKEVGKGTGLGLAVCKGIINEHNGDINISSTPGEGTCVTITIPTITEEKTD